MNATTALSSCALCAAAFAASAAPSAAPRDPMQPPAAAAGPAAAPAAPKSPRDDGAGALPTAWSLLVVGERRWVVEGGRRRGVGDMLGTARIERIEESAVTVRHGGRLQRLPVYAGIAKQRTQP
jgi:hypothetical protein